MSLRNLSLALLSAAATSAQAHGGHGAVQWHWHATDAWGFVVVAALAAIAIWFSRGD
jgi:hypothetical protein